MDGTVIAFDEARGLGSIETADGSAHPFHCTALLDGTRSVHAGAVVTFELRPAGMGRWEATHIVKH